jgi:parallel beta-helix repeat protein
MADNPYGHTIETSVIPSAFHSAGDNVTIRGFIVEKYASVSGSGAIAQHVGFRKSVGTRWIIEDNEIRFNHSAGIKVADGAQVRRNYVHDNGQSGIACWGAGLLPNPGIVIEDNESAYNNTAKYEFSGGIAGFNIDDLVVRDNYVHDNRGKGIWCDRDCVNTIFEDNTVEDNRERGLQIELSFMGIIRNNFVRRNGYGTWLGSGINIAESSDVEVHGNILEDNSDGITIRHAYDRGISSKLGLPYESENNHIHDNIVTFTSSATTLNQVGTIHGLYTGTGDSSYYCCRNNRYSNNTYNVPPDALIFRWNFQQMTLAEWHALGLD